MRSLRKTSRRGKGTGRKGTGRKVRKIGGKRTGRKGTGRKGTRRKGRKYRQRGGNNLSTVSDNMKKLLKDTITEGVQDDSSDEETRITAVKNLIFKFFKDYDFSVFEDIDNLKTYKFGHYAEEYFNLLLDHFKLKGLDETRYKIKYKDFSTNDDGKVAISDINEIRFNYIMNNIYDYSNFTLAGFSGDRRKINSRTLEFRRNSIERIFH